MKNQPYDDHGRENMILRDWLAMDRTLFAATRTFNDYLKIFITGIIATLVFMGVLEALHESFMALIYVGFALSVLLITGGAVLLFQAMRHHRKLHHD